jgi:hypothetical protein
VTDRLRFARSWMALEEGIVTGAAWHGFVALEDVRAALSIAAAVQQHREHLERASDVCRAGFFDEDAEGLNRILQALDTSMDT